MNNMKKVRYNNKPMEEKNKAKTKRKIHVEILYHHAIKQLI